MGTGASFTTLPSSLLRELGIEATGKRGFLLADGRRVEMDYGQAWATIDGESVVTIVVFGKDEAPPLLGAYTAFPYRLPCATLDSQNILRHPLKIRGETDAP